MSSQRWQRVSEVFEAARRRAPAERPAYLDRTCEGDASLRAEVEALLSSYDKAGGFLEDPAAPPQSLVSAAVNPDEGAATTLRRGDRLGPYEILELLGAGGMGEVYRARDSRLRREVAVKVISPSLPASVDALRRFDQEARAAGSLNHPNILTVYDVGEERNVPYVVTERLEGQTLRERLADGPLAWTKALDYALQAARGLAAAHAGGIVHRDLKPENLFVTRDGRVKILDFGLAKLTQTDLPGPRTETGKVLGTIGYMSPEQVRGDPVDARSDLFSLGSILYEMLGGSPPFRRETPVETLNAILKEEPPQILATPPPVPPDLERVVAHCLEKAPENRFQAARDLAFDLELLLRFPGYVGSAAGAAHPAARRSRLAALLWGLALLAAAAMGLVVGRQQREAAIPSYRQLTFRRGTIEAARFSPDGFSVLYTAAWEGQKPEIFSMRLDTLSPRPLGLPGTRLLSVAPGEMAVLLPGPHEGAGTIARAPLEGGAAREVLEDVLEADMDRTGASFAVARRVGGRTRLEYPLGQILFETPGDIGSPRVSPDGSRVAFFEQPVLGDTRGSVMVVDVAGKDRRTLSPGWTASAGLAWSPRGDEVWFGATTTGVSHGLYAVSLAGKQRPVARTPGAMVLQDIAADGRVLLAHTHRRSEALGKLAGDAEERDLSWFDWTHATDLSTDGQRLLFTEEGESAGPNMAVYLRRITGSAPLRLGEGHSMTLSPDGSWAIAHLRSASPRRLVLLPTGPGSARVLPRGAIADYHWAWWFPDGRRILVLANETDRPPRLFAQDVPDGEPRPVGAEGVTAAGQNPISPDGRWVVAFPAAPARARLALYPLAGGDPLPLPAIAPDDQPIRWGADGRLFVRSTAAGFPIRVDRLEPAAARRERWLEIPPDDPAGIRRVRDVLLTPDGESYAYIVHRSLSELYLVEGLR